MTGGAVVDRKILRAFYTQYVAVLLIVLVFSISLAQRGVVRPASSGVVIAGSKSSAPIGSMELRGIFTSDTSTELSSGRELGAVFEALGSHDLRAIFTVYSPLKAHRQEHVHLAIRRARAIRSRAAGLHIPAQAVRVLVAPTRRIGVQASVSFVSMEVADESS